jgi:hypothetical protein
MCEGIPARDHLGIIRAQSSPKEREAPVVRECAVTVGLCDFESTRWVLAPQIVRSVFGQSSAAPADSRRWLKKP